MTASLGVWLREVLKRRPADARAGHQ